METGIARQAETSIQRGQLSQQSSKRIEIVELLAKYSLRRSVAVNPEGLAVYSEDLLPYEMCDVEAALLKLGQEPRLEKKVALHDIGTILAEVRGFKRGRMIAADKAVRAEKEKQYRKTVEREREEDRKLGVKPVIFDEITAPLVAKFGRTGEK